MFFFFFIFVVVFDFLLGVDSPNLLPPSSPQLAPLLPFPILPPPTRVVGGVFDGFSLGGFFVRVVWWCLGWCGVGWVVVVGCCGVGVWGVVCIFWVYKIASLDE